MGSGKIYLYLMFDDKKTMVKVGVSENPIKRILKFERELSGFKVDSSISLCFLGDEKMIKHAEKGSHKTFYKYKINHKYNFDGYTEWFNMSCYDDLIQYLEKYFEIRRDGWLPFDKLLPATPL